MLTLDDKGGGGVEKPTKLAYVIHGCSLSNIYSGEARIPERLNN